MAHNTGVRLTYRVTPSDGPQVLFQTDLLAHQSLMAETHFQTHHIEHNAGVLASQLCSVVSRALISNGTQTADDAFARNLLPSQQSDDIDPLGDFFTQAFIHALGLKAKLLLSQNKYKLV